MGGLHDTLGRIARSQEAWQGDWQKNHYVWELGQEMFGSHKGKQVKLGTGIKAGREKGVCGCACGSVLPGFALKLRTA